MTSLTLHQGFEVFILMGILIYTSYYLILQLTQLFKRSRRSCSSHCGHCKG